MPSPDSTLPPPDLRARLHALWRRSVFNPYHLDGRLLHEGVAALAPDLGGRMLDVGCGERQYARHLVNVRRYVGIEHLAAVINVNNRLADSVARVRGVIDAFAEGERLPFRDGSFDSALCTEVLEHVPRPELVVAEIRRVLRPDAPLLVTVPFVGELHQVPYDFRRFTEFGIRRLLEDHGFVVERIVPRGNFTSTTGRVLAQALYRMGAKRVKPDGSVQMRKWAIPVVLPLCGLASTVFGFAARFGGDPSLCLGYAVLARRAE